MASVQDVVVSVSCCVMESLVDVREAAIHVSQVQLEGGSRPFPAVTPCWVPAPCCPASKQHQHLRVGGVKLLISYWFSPCKQYYQSLCVRVCFGFFTVLWTFMVSRG